VLRNSQARFGGGRLETQVKLCAGRLPYFVVVSNAPIAEIREAKQEIKDFLTHELHLELSEEKTLITHVNDGFEFLGFHIQRTQSNGKWAVHLRPREESKRRVKKKLKDLTSRNWTWMDEYSRMTTLNRIVRGWCEYYKHTSLLSDLEEITRFVWFRYLQWLLRKYKGSRKRQLIRTKTGTVHNRTRWIARIGYGEHSLTAHQWLPTRKELWRTKYGQKGRDGFPHPYLTPELQTTDHPEGEMEPNETFFKETIGATSRNKSRKEPLELNERKLIAKMRDGFRCVRCGDPDNLRVHHIKGMKSHELDDLETLCLKCHHLEHGYKNILDGEPDVSKGTSPVR